MKILVTGSAGHLGEALVRILRSQRAQVIGVDILRSPFTDIVGSITERAVVDECMPGVTHVLHAATSTARPRLRPRTCAGCSIAITPCPA